MPDSSRTSSQHHAHLQGSFAPCTDRRPRTPWRHLLNATGVTVSAMRYLLTALAMPDQTLARRCQVGLYIFGSSVGTIWCLAVLLRWRWYTSNPQVLTILLLGLSTLNSTSFLWAPLNTPSQHMFLQRMCVFAVLPTMAGRPVRESMPLLLTFVIPVHLALDSALQYKLCGTATQTAQQPCTPLTVPYLLLGRMLPSVAVLMFAILAVSLFTEDPREDSAMQPTDRHTPSPHEQPAHQYQSMHQSFVARLKQRAWEVFYPQALVHSCCRARQQARVWWMNTKSDDLAAWVLWPLCCIIMCCQILRISTGTCASPLKVLLALVVGIGLGHLEGKDITGVLFNQLSAMTELAHDLVPSHVAELLVQQMARPDSHLPSRESFASLTSHNPRSNVSSCCGSLHNHSLFRSSLSGAQGRADRHPNLPTQMYTAFHHGGLRSTSGPGTPVPEPCDSRSLSGAPSETLQRLSDFGSPSLHPEGASHTRLVEARLFKPDQRSAPIAAAAAAALAQLVEQAAATGLGCFKQQAQGQGSMEEDRRQPAEDGERDDCMLPFTLEDVEEEECVSFSLHSEARTSFADVSAPADREGGFLLSMTTLAVPSADGQPTTEEAQPQPYPILGATADPELREGQAPRAQPGAGVLGAGASPGLGGGRPPRDPSSGRGSEVLARSPPPEARAVDFSGLLPDYVALADSRVFCWHPGGQGGGRVGQGGGCQSDGPGATAPEHHPPASLGWRPLDPPREPGDNNHMQIQRKYASWSQVDLTDSPPGGSPLTSGGSPSMRSYRSLLQWQGDRRNFMWGTQHPAAKGVAGKSLGDLVEDLIPSVGSAPTALDRRGNTAMAGSGANPLTRRSQTQGCIMVSRSASGAHPQPARSRSDVTSSARMTNECGGRHSNDHSIPVGVQPQRLVAFSHTSVTILFSDIVGFTSLSKALEPYQVFEFLNELYARYDAVVDRYRVYKVETIGDCYMCATGLIKDDPEHAAQMVRFAQEMQRQAAQVQMPDGSGPVRVRIGINSGPLLSGVIGRIRKRYCVVGSTVNLASRMESTGVPGRVHISSDTHALVQHLDEFTWECRGEVAVKGAGNMVTYLLEC